MEQCLQIHPNDNVAVALHPLASGSVVCGVTVLEDIPQGHKIALRPIAVGEDIMKYGFPIGHATEQIVAGAWVHTHNLATNLSEEAAYLYAPCNAALTPQASDVFFGFRRKNGNAAVRNEIWIIPTVGCINDVAKALARENQGLVYGTIEGLYAFTHPCGCSQTGADHAQTRRLLAALAQHPNAAAVLVLELGCENLTHDQFVQELGEYDHERILFLNCQNVDNELVVGRALLQQCADYAAQFQREPIFTSELVVGLKCGGSDGLSGITANPVVGRFSDLLVAQGGTSILTEVPEMFGAEGILLDRCINDAVFQKASDMIAGFKRYFKTHGEVVYENPSPGNKAGGITTLEEKSCGCVQKGGSAPITDVLEYGEQIRTCGLQLLSGPGNDLVSATALTAAGAHIILFTTGRGTPFGAPAPTMKIATNSNLAQKKQGWIDFNAGCVADGKQSVDEVSRQLLRQVLEVASGTKTCSENNGFREISIFKDGVVL